MDRDEPFSVAAKSVAKKMSAASTRRRAGEVSAHARVFDADSPGDVRARAGARAGCSSFELCPLGDDRPGRMRRRAAI